MQETFPSSGALHAVCTTIALALYFTTAAAQKPVHHDVCEEPTEVVVVNGAAEQHSVAIDTEIG